MRIGPLADIFVTPRVAAYYLVLGTPAIPIFVNFAVLIMTKTAGIRPDY